MRLRRKERKMPKVGKKKFPYTAAGRKAASREAAKTGKKMTKKQVKGYYSRKKK